MVALTGADDQTFIDKAVFDKIRACLGRSHYETGGILGMSNGMINAFEFDIYSGHELFEYYPTADFFESVINGVWAGTNISFCGFVHSHLHNNVISEQDALYTRETLRANKQINTLIMGIYDLSAKKQPLRWYSVNLLTVKEINVLCA